MSADIQIFPIHRGVDPYAAAVMHQPSSESEQILWIVPTPTHAHTLRRRLLAKQVGAQAPLVYAIQDFADELCQNHEPTSLPLTDPVRRLILDAAIAELRDATPPIDFNGASVTRGFADSADGFFREVKQAGLDPGQFRKIAGSKYGHHARLFTVIERMRTKLHRLDPDDRLARAAEIWQAGQREPFSNVSRLAVVGFVTFTERQWKLLASLAASVANVLVTVPGGNSPTPDEVFDGIVQPAEVFTRFGQSPESTLEDRNCEPATRPAGLDHLTRTLFKTSAPTVAADAAGLNLIEAPGPVGEARLVARSIRSLLAEGIQPDAIVVTARDLDHIDAFVREVFDQYDVPYHWPERDPLARCPAVAALLRAWRLPDEDYPFARVAALLRNTYFRPAWKVVKDDPELPLRAEALLRQLGEAQGKEAYLTAVEMWCESPPLPLEDEQADEPRRKRRHRLAIRCRPFLTQFFQLWDNIPPTATSAAYADRLARLAADIGLSRNRVVDPLDAAGLTHFLGVMDDWARVSLPSAANEPVITKTAFDRMLDTIAAFTRSPLATATDRVRVLPAEDARGADCDHLFILDLGEGSFPKLAPLDSLLDDAERNRLRGKGAAFTKPEHRLSNEMLLFLDLIARPRHELHLSYPAVDGRGQPLLPSSFLTAVAAGFEPGTIALTKQRMTIEGYATGEVYSAAEERVRLARQLATRHASDDRTMSRDLVENLQAAHTVAAARFQNRNFGPYDGLIRHTTTAADLAERLGPEKVFSPTALEAYVACPFRFWLEHVLRLEPLDEPGVEIEHTRRGAAVHRAFARFHKRDRTTALLEQTQLPDRLTAELEQTVLAAVEEYATRAASAASKMLWRLEGKRLLRSIARYRGHWEEFRGPWQEKGVNPIPHELEAEFGLPANPGETKRDPLVVTIGDVEVRIGGKIDRVDIAELPGGVGFWVIDYKTGSGQYYTGAALKRFERLQLPLYALAVEKVVLKGKKARPLGLAYWMVTGDGAKPVLPDKRSLQSWHADHDRWNQFRQQLEEWVATLVRHIRAGDFPLAPRSEDCTDTCHLGPVCRIAQARPVAKLWLLPLPVATGSPSRVDD